MRKEGRTLGSCLRWSAIHILTRLGSDSAALAPVLECRGSPGSIAYLKAVQHLRLHSKHVERDAGSYTQPSMTSYLLLFGFSCVFSPESEMPFLCQKSHLHIAAQNVLQVYSLIKAKVFIFDCYTAAFTG